MLRIPLINGNPNALSELSEKDILYATLFAVVHKRQDGHPIFARRHLLRQDFDNFVEDVSHFSKRDGGDGGDLSTVEVQLGLLEGTHHISGAGPGCVCCKQAVELLE